MSDTGRVVLGLPARGEFARTARLVAAEIAVRAGLCIDDVDDVRLAVEEAFVYGCSQGPQTVNFEFDVADGSVGLLMGPLPSCDADDEATGDAGERYARFILESICDEFEIFEREDGCFVRLVKRAAA